MNFTSLSLSLSLWFLLCSFITRHLRRVSLCMSACLSVFRVVLKQNEITCRDADDVCRLWINSLSSSSQPMFLQHLGYPTFSLSLSFDFISFSINDRHRRRWRRRRRRKGKRKNPQRKGLNKKKKRRLFYVKFKLRSDLNSATFFLLKIDDDVRKFVIYA